MRPTRLGIVVSHPIQYQAPLHRQLASSPHLEVDVLFLSNHGVKDSFDEGFGREVAYDVPLLEGYPYRFLPNWSPVPSVSRMWGLINPSVITAINQRDHDVVLVNGYDHVSKWLAMMTAKSRGVPYMLRGDSRLDTDRYLSLSKLRLKRATVGRIVRGAAACLAIGQQNREFYLGYGSVAERIYCAPFCVDNAHFSAYAEMPAQRRTDELLRMGLDPARPVVMFSGKLQPWKRPRDLLAACRLQKERPNVIIAGDGPLRAELKADAEQLGCVVLTGFVNQSRLPLLYGLADVLVVPSEKEQWNLSVNEAMAAGTAVLLSDAVGCAPDLALPDTGAVFPTGDVRALAQELEGMLGNSRRLERMKAAARVRIQSFSLERCAAGIEAAARAVAG